VTQPACAYIVSRYPSLTHAFVMTEVRALRASGVRVETASVRRVDRAQVLSSEQRDEYARTHALLPTSAAHVLRCHARAFAHSPRAYVGTLARALRLAHAGGRARLWQLFYFAEAMLLWAWLREQAVSHVRVHHANVSADLAMLACGFANAAGAEPRWTWSLTLHGPTELLDVDAHKLPVKVADAAAVVCTSDWSRSQVTAFAEPGHLASIATVRCGIDVRAFRPSAEGGDGILCVAALSRRKGHAVLLDALALLHERGTPARLTLVGDGPERPRLEAQAEQLGLGDAVRFTGPVANDAVPGYYARADVFCLPSFAEGLPTVLMEAMAAGLPVVATNVNGTAELVEDGVSGRVVAPARADLLADALEPLLGDPRLRERIGRAARERVEQSYVLEDAVGRMWAFVSARADRPTGTS
jgi:colanic acid/amylovoran biosynthesis glycosyltransferase